MADRIDYLWIQKVERGVVQVHARMTSGADEPYTPVMDVVHTHTHRGKNLLVCLSQNRDHGYVLSEDPATRSSRVAVGPTMTLLEAEVAAAHLMMA